MFETAAPVTQGWVAMTALLFLAGYFVVSIAIELAKLVLEAVRQRQVTRAHRRRVQIWHDTAVSLRADDARPPEPDFLTSGRG